ncbi:MAG: hypothetical protein NTV55_11040 [Planctomycetota bacterium]|nr:hypothetical protein [Planctomycetota bacterium]
MNNTFFFQNEADMQNFLHLQKTTIGQGDGLASLSRVMARLASILVACPECGHFSCAIHGSEKSDPLAGTVWSEPLETNWRNGHTVTTQVPALGESPHPEGHSMEVHLQMTVNAQGKTVLRLKIQEGSNSQDCHSREADPFGCYLPASRFAIGSLDSLSLCCSIPDAAGGE